MKKFFTYQWLFIAALLLTLSACDKDKSDTPVPPVPDLPISIDQTAFHFTSKAAETLLVTVSNTSEWEVRNDAAWLTVEKQSGSTLKVTAIPSRSLADRSATLTIVAKNPEQGEASLEVTQAHGTPRLLIRQFTNGMKLRHCSENGRWAAAQRSENVLVVDIDRLRSESGYAGTYTQLPGGVHSIDNNGTPHSNGCSADGTMSTGYDVQPAIDNGPLAEFFPSRYIPYIMRNNRKIALAYPETTPLDNIEEPGYITRHMYQGCIPDKMSADGKYIYGRMMNMNTMWFAAKWTRIGDSNEYTFKELGQHADGDLNEWQKVFTDFEGQTFMTIEPVSFLASQNITGLSLYGKYACGHYGSSLSGGGQLFRYDMEAEELQLLDATGMALHVTDDGTLFDSNGYVYLLGESTPITTREWVTRIYGSNMSGAAPAGFIVNSVSADYTTTVLFSNNQLEGSSYVITVEP